VLGTGSTPSVQVRRVRRGSLRHAQDRPHIQCSGIKDAGGQFTSCPGRTPHPVFRLKGCGEAVYVVPRTDPTSSVQVRRMRGGSLRRAQDELHIQCSGWQDVEGQFTSCPGQTPHPVFRLAGCGGAVYVVPRTNSTPSCSGKRGRGEAVYVVPRTTPIFDVLTGRVWSSGLRHAQDVASSGSVMELGPRELGVRSGLNSRGPSWVPCLGFGATA